MKDVVSRPSGGQPVNPCGAACSACDDPRMVEYGNGVGQVAGRAGGGGGAAGHSTDIGAALSQAINDSMTTLGTLPPAVLLLLASVVLVLGWVLLKKLI